jgi:hypothetical protein
MVNVGTVKVKVSPAAHVAAFPDTTISAMPLTKVNVVDGMVAVPPPASAMETPLAIARLNQVWISPAAVCNSTKILWVQAAVVIFFLPNPV